jgi:hypothetical protein
MSRFVARESNSIWEVEPFKTFIASKFKAQTPLIKALFRFSYIDTLILFDSSNCEVASNNFYSNNCYSFWNLAINISRSF